MLAISLFLIYMLFSAIFFDFALKKISIMMIVNINMVIKICKECFGAERMIQVIRERNYDNFF